MKGFAVWLGLVTVLSSASFSEASFCWWEEDEFHDECCSPNGSRRHDFAQCLQYQLDCCPENIAIGECPIPEGIGHCPVPGNFGQCLAPDGVGRCPTAEGVGRCADPCPQCPSIEVSSVCTKNCRTLLETAWATHMDALWTCLKLSKGQKLGLTKRDCKLAVSRCRWDCLPEIAP